MSARSPASSPPAGVAIVQFWPNWHWILAVLAVFFVGQFLEGNILSPKLVGDSVGLHPVWLMFALFAFGSLFGFVGLLLAVPLAAAVGVLTRFALERYLASPLYTGVPREPRRRCQDRADRGLSHGACHEPCPSPRRTSSCSISASRRASPARISWRRRPTPRRWRLIERWPDWPDRAVGAGRAGGHRQEPSRRDLGRPRLGRGCWRAALHEADLADLLAERRAGDRGPRPGRRGARPRCSTCSTWCASSGRGSWSPRGRRRPPGSACPICVSRLRALPVATIAPADDALLEAMAFKLFADRGVDVEPVLVKYLVTRIERSAAALARAVADLDRRRWRCGAR